MIETDHSVTIIKYNKGHLMPMQTSWPDAKDLPKGSGA